MKKFKGSLAVLIGAASFGILSTFVKKAYSNGFSVGEITGIQTFFGMVILWILYLTIGSKADKTKFKQKTKKWKIVLSGFSTGAVSILYYKAVELIPASLAIVLLMQFIWISALLNFIFFKQLPTKRELLGVISILAATLLATGVFEAHFGQISFQGILYGLLAATAYALFILVNGRVGNDYPAITKSALMITGAFVFVFIIFQPTSIFQFQSNSLLHQFGIVLSLFGTILPHSFMHMGCQKQGFH